MGILAGMGPHSTAPFLELVIAECQRQYGAADDIGVDWQDDVDSNVGQASSLP